MASPPQRQTSRLTRTSPNSQPDHHHYEASSSSYDRIKAATIEASSGRSLLGEARFEADKITVL